MQKMYPAVVNSPKTELVTDIAATDIEIEVSDASVLLAPEGLAVIGNGEGAETIKYSDVDGNVLKECIRGFQGTAKQWAAGTRLARNFTAYDHDTFMANIKQHDGVITALENRLDSADTIDLTLQPGLQVVNAAKDARFNLGQIEGKTEINYDGRIGLIGVENLYAIRYGENLLPPFYKWVVSAGATSTDAVIDPYLLQKTVPSAAQPTEIVVPVLGGQHLTLSYESSDSVAAYINIQWLDRDRSPISWTDQNEGGQTVLSPDNARFARVTATTLSAGTFTFKNPTLTLGTDPKTFKPREDSMLAFQTELHANPDDGSDPDVLFEREGQYFKLAKWKKVTIDGSIKWGASPASFYGFKVIGTLPDQFPRWKLYSEKATKYDGLILKTATSGGSWATNGADTTETSIDGSFYISISNADSGWGDDYTPMQDEIRAYFMGYQMGYLNGSAFAAPYNGTGTKVWRAIVGDTGSGSSTLPTSPSSVAIAAGWVPYQLVYQLASPTVEPVVSEGCLTLNEGDNQVEVGTGFVLRESVRVNSTSGISYINADYPFNSKPYDIKEVYRENYSDPEWKVSYRPDTDPYYERNGRAFAYIPTVLYDSSAPYSVTYLKLDKSPTQPIIGTMAANEKAQISDLTTGVAEALQRVSVVEMKKTDKDTPAVLITPTLLNGWEQYPLYHLVGYYKDSLGIVHLTGLVRKGSANTVIFTLPQCYRPITTLIFAVFGQGKAVRIDVQAGGNVHLNHTPWYPDTDWVSLDGISFLAEQ